MTEKTLTRYLASSPQFIVLQRFLARKDAPEQICQSCGSGMDSYTIEIFEDVHTALRLDICGEKPKKIDGYLWEKVLSEQLQQGTYIIHAFMHVCSSCADLALQAAYGDPRVCPVFFAAVSQNQDVMLVIGRYSNKPRGKPTVTLTSIEDIHEFVSEFKEQDAIPGRKTFMKYGAVGRK